MMDCDGYSLANQITRGAGVHRGCMYRQRGADRRGGQRDIGV